MPVATSGPVFAPTQVSRAAPCRRLFVGQGTATTTAAILVTENDDRLSVLIVNTGANALLIGGPDVVTGDSFSLPAGAGVSTVFSGQLWGATAAATTNWSMMEESL